ncbi:hypothetical protein KCU76_g6059, partial [Aureobasidium melanogenum]
MDEEALLATAIARFRPLNQPLPPGFDIDSLPVYRAPVSLQKFKSADAESTEHATSLVSDAGPSSPAPEDPAAHPTPQRLSCERQGYSENFDGADAPARLVYKIFFCSVCGRGFQQKAHVVRHEGTHVEEE